MAKKPTTALEPVNLAALPVEVKKLKVIVEIDPEKLRHEVEQYTDGHASLELSINTIRVTDDETNANCLALRNNAAKREAGLTKIWERLKDPINEVRKEILNLEHQTVDPFTALKDSATKKSEKYIMEQRRAKVAAEKQFERIADQERRTIEDEANNLISQGFVAQGEARLAEAQMVQQFTLPDATPKVDGCRIGEKFIGKCADIVAVMKAIVDGKAPLVWDYKDGERRALVVIDQVVLNAIVKRHGKETEKLIPGIVVEEGVSIGATKL